MTDSKWKEMAERTTILRALTGSEAYGLQLDGGSDRDERGVCIEDFEAAFALNGEFEQYEYRTAEERDGKDAKSQPGDLDLVIYSLRKFLRLATYGNPNVVELLFIRDSKLRTVCDARGVGLQDLAPSIISRQVGRRFLGYMEAQKQRLLGERGQMRVTRTELIEKYGYDTKYASHVIRLGFQGIELLETGKLALPMPEQPRGITLRVKQGKCSLNEVLQLAGDLEQTLKDLIKEGPLQDQPDYAEVEKWMHSTYFETWRARYATKPEVVRYTQMFRNGGMRL